ncbi:MAG: tetratricopeptide repeat protein [Candidatus Parcubacteria bacterium]|nr:tetratricopeptide repeat protein [Burkholderiales bacterium]
MSCGTCAVSSWLKKLFAREGPSESGRSGQASEAHIDDWMREAYALHKEGKLADAEDRYRRILRAQSENVDALYLLGEISNRSGRHERAIELIGKAIAASPGVAAFHHEFAMALRSNREHARAESSFAKAIELAPNDLQSLTELGDLQLEMGKPSSAEKSFREIERLSPGLLATSVNLGSALMAQNRLDEAAEWLDKALEQDPFCVQALSNLGVVNIKRKDIPAAQRLLERALEFDPFCFEAQVNLAVVLQKQAKWDKAMRILEEAVRTRPDHPHVKHSLARAYWHRSDYDAAERALRDAVRLAPDLIDPAVDLSKILFETGRIEEALAHMRTVLQNHLKQPVAHVALGYMLEMVGEFTQAMACYEDALALDPASVQAHVNRGVLWILTGDLERGWPEYEWRLRTDELIAAYGRFPLPRWDGGSLAGRTLLVHAEQGLGDEILYGSCLPDAIRQAKHCVIECADRLVPIFSRSFPQATVRGMAKGDIAQWLKDVPPIDVQIPTGSLPLHFRRKAADFPREQPYLKADPDRAKAWKTRLEDLSPRMKIGLSWRGGVPMTGNALRSIPLEQLLPILGQQDVSFVSLQYGDVKNELARLEHSHGIAVQHWQEAIDDYEETAALMCALDLTITVCTAVVHLGGAQGLPVWILTPLRPEARYGASGHTMQWYSSARMFRQARVGDWSGVVDKAAAELRQAVTRRVLPSIPAAVTPQ